MKTTYKRAIVYDLETGGLDCDINAITEFAAVVVDLETLDIIDECSVMFLPRLDFSNINNDPLKDAKMLYKNLSVKDEDTKEKILKFGDKRVLQKDLHILLPYIEKFYQVMDEDEMSTLFTQEQFDNMCSNNNDIADIAKLFYDNIYNPEALRITKISKDMLMENGVAYTDGFNVIKEFFLKHKVGNSKPIIAGHNIGNLPRRHVKGKEKAPNGFDNPFMEILFNNNNEDFFSYVHDFVLDTLMLAKLKWVEISSFNLGTCANDLGLTIVEAHRALNDAQGNAKVLIKMLKALRGDGNSASKYVRKKYSFNF